MHLKVDFAGAEYLGGQSTDSQVHRGLIGPGPFEKGPNCPAAFLL